MSDPRTPRVVVDGLVFPECPRWYDGALWFSDMHSGYVHRLVPGEAAEMVVKVDGDPAGLGWTPDGDLLVVSMQKRQLLRYSSGRFVVVAEFGDHHPGPSNELVVDTAGRAYVGNIGYDYFNGADPAPTNLVRVDPDGSIQIVARELMVPNGMVLSADGRELILAESLGHRLTRFAVAPDGSLDDRQVFADLTGRTPDGIASDPSGDIWFASVRAHEVVRVARGGQVVDTVSVGQRQAVACVLGGTTGRTLYICAVDELGHEDARRARSGVILAAELEP